MTYIPCKKQRLDNSSKVNADEIQSIPIDPTPPEEGEILEFDGAKWVPTALPGDTTIRIRLAANFSISSGSVEVPITFTADDILYDPQGMFAIANPTRITIPQNGLYEIIGNVNWQGTSSGSFRQLTVAVDGTAHTKGAVLVFGSGVPPINSVYALANLDAGDIITFTCAHNASTALNLLAASGCNFSVSLVA